MNLMVVSTDKLTDLIIENLRAHADNDLKIVFHLGKKNSDLHASTIRRMTISKDTKRFIFDQQYLNNFSLKFSEDPQFSRSLFSFIDHLYRSNKDIAIKANEIEYIHEAYDYFYLAFDYFCGLIKEYGIDHILFFNIPHLGYDTICYEVAKFLKIKTTIVSQSIFDNKFISLSDISNFGKFKVDESLLDRFTITQKLKRPFYMGKINNDPTPSKHPSLIGYLSVFLYVVLRKPVLLFKFKDLFNLLSRVNSIYKRTPKWRDPFAKFFNVRSLKYFEHMAGIPQGSLNLEEKFVYFPLHLQPEMTTSALGGVFVDQALAIEILSNMLPSNVIVYVKENPKQMGFMRGPTFFHRIMRLNNVKIIPDYIDSHELIKRSVFVATITGTAGWEALAVGKPVLVFGTPWFLSLPGVVKYSKLLTYEEISNIKINHDALEKATAQLLHRMHDGIIDRHYKVLVSDYSEMGNSQKVAQTLKKLLLGKIPYTFN